MSSRITLRTLHPPRGPQQLSSEGNQGLVSKGRGTFPQHGGCRIRTRLFPGVQQVLTVSVCFLLVKLLEEVLRPPLWVGAWHRLLEIVQQSLQAREVRGLSEVLCALVKPGPQDGGDRTRKQRRTVTAPAGCGDPTRPGHQAPARAHPRKTRTVVDKEAAIITVSEFISIRKEAEGNRTSQAWSPGKLRRKPQPHTGPSSKGITSLPSPLERWMERGAQAAEVRGMQGGACLSV